MHPIDVYNKSIKVSILPKTPLGKWSTGFIGAFVVFFVATILIVNLGGQQGGETFFSYPVPAVLLLLAVASGVLALLTGLISVIRKKERSILVFLAILIGFFVLSFALGEVLVPH